MPSVYVMARRETALRGRLTKCTEQGPNQALFAPHPRSGTWVKVPSSAYPRNMYEHIHDDNTYLYVVCSASDVHQ